MLQLARQPERSALTGRAYLESRIAQHDGYLWPFDRPQMLMPGPIRERMVEDIGRLVRDGGEEAIVSLADLVALGWPLASVEACGAAAFAVFNVQEARREREELDGAGRPFVEAAALLLFCSAALLWAGVGAGAI
ncbi:MULTISPECIES: hypothetical protein [unclassified Bosea (in: a-proteobacteria)]|uniref:hypothetical protein n=1 Tax=unclassified Bosea (in: a-proteobacteria) TaxID=2653178 RepID=UPI000F7F03EA|nr:MULTISPECIES: hypothetical protein [unclassified Bosea (in: a-proteobacteria)]